MSGIPVEIERLVQDVVLLGVPDAIGVFTLVKVDEALGVADIRAVVIDKDIAGGAAAEIDEPAACLGNREAVAGLLVDRQDRPSSQQMRAEVHAPFGAHDDFVLGVEVKVGGAAS